jgi:hypothetical protein
MRAILTVSMASILAGAPVQSQMPDVMKPGAGHRRLDPLVGSWDVAVRFRFGTGPERTGRARAQAVWTLDGRLLRQDYTAESGQLTLQQWGFDNQRGTYYLIKFDNFETGVVHAEGSVSEDGRTITTIGDRVDPMTGKVGVLRIVLTLIDADHFNIEWYARQQDGSETRTVLMEHTRRR